MNKKFTPEERKSYMVDKLSQLEETTEALAAICFLKVEAVNQYLCGDKVIEASIPVLNSSAVILPFEYINFNTRLRLPMAFS